MVNFRWVGSLSVKSQTGYSMHTSLYWILGHKYRLAKQETAAVISCLNPSLKLIGSFSDKS